LERATTLSQTEGGGTEGGQKKNRQKPSKIPRGGMDIDNREGESNKRKGRWHHY